MNHPIRFVRALLAVTGALGGGCASTVVGTGDVETDVAAGPDGARDAASETTVHPPVCQVMESCPATEPTNGSPCATSRSYCDYPNAGGGSGTGCNCEARNDAGCGMWSCHDWIAGPLPPPEFTA